MSEHVTMSDKELTRLKVMQQLEEKRIKQREAAKKLKISERHVRRILRSYRQSGAAGLDNVIQAVNPKARTNSI